MASGFIFLFLAMLLVVLPGMMAREAGSRQLKNSSMDADTQQKRKNQSKGNVISIDHRKSKFLPSFHLGPIQTFIESTNDIKNKGSKSLFNAEVHKMKFSDRTNLPFNSLQTIKFDNVHKSKNISEKNSLGNKENIVKFVYNAKDYEEEEKEEERFKGQNILKLNHRYSHLPIRVEQPEYPMKQHDVQEVKYVHENHNSGSQYLTFETKPSKFYDPTMYLEVPYQQLIHTGNENYLQYRPELVNSYGADEKYVNPDSVINVHPMSYQATSFDMHTKPKTVVYVTSHETTVTKKIPYEYYRPIIYEHNVEPVIVSEVTPEYKYPIFYEHENKSIIPWKKFFHLISAFLPLGLLFALFKPKIVNIDQNSDPNKSLSKLRINDLPAEHKQNHFLYDTDDQHECDERLICRLLAAADQVNTNFLQHLLTQVTDRTPESVIRKKELERIFEAAKLGNCDILTCNFYDGT